MQDTIHNNLEITGNTSVLTVLRHNKPSQHLSEYDKIA